MSVDYQSYIISDAWRRRRAKFLRIQPHCQACGTKTRLQVHHLTYEHLGDEPNGDLMTLCESHHSAVHKYHTRTRLSLRSATNVFVKRFHRELEAKRLQKQEARQKRQKHTRPVREEPSERPDFVPANQRMTLEERQVLISGGQRGRLRGIPVAAVKRPLTPTYQWDTELEGRKRRRLAMQAALEQRAK